MEKQLKEMLDKIRKGDFENESYLMQFGDVDSRNPVERFFLYKSDREEVWQGADCDVSLAAVVTYGLMYDWLGVGENIKPQEREAKNYKIISKKGNCYYGDTMTSAWTFFQEYLDFLWHGENASAEYKALFEESKRGKIAVPKNKDKSIYKNLFDYLADKILTNDDGNNYLEIIDRETSDEMKAFLENYMKAGNCLAVPTDFNTARSGFGRTDTVDRMLWKIFQYFSSENDEYLKQLFNYAKDKDESVKSFKAWMEEADIKSWDEFIEDNLLQPFVDMKNSEHRPISMKTGRCVNENQEVAEDYFPMPNIITEFETFFGNLNEKIVLRSRLIYEKCKGKIR